MKKIEINYTTNEQLWTLETVAEAHGYNKKSDCYWAQIFENAAGDQIITSREDTASADPVAELAALLNEAEAPAETAEQYTEIRTMDDFTLRGICIKNHWYTRGTCDQYGKLFDRLLQDGRPANLTTAKLAEIAADIMAHSDMEPDYQMEDVMFALAADCITHFSRR